MSPPLSSDFWILLASLFRAVVQGRPFCWGNSNELKHAEGCLIPFPAPHRQHGSLWQPHDRHGTALSSPRLGTVESRGVEGGGEEEHRGEEEAGVPRRVRWRRDGSRARTLVAHRFHRKQLQIRCSLWATCFPLVFQTFFPTWLILVTSPLPSLSWACTHTAPQSSPGAWLLVLTDTVMLHTPGRLPKFRVLWVVLIRRWRWWQSQASLLWSSVYKECAMWGIPKHRKN